LSEIQSLARGLQIIEKLAEASDGLSITDLADTFEVDKGSISRLMQTLAHYGFAEKDKRSRKYISGPQIVRHSRTLLQRISIRDIAKPFLKQLVEATGECAHLAILVQGQAFYIDQEESQNALRVTTNIGSLAPLYSTALGKVLLAFSDTAIPEELTPFTMRTITDASMLKRHIEIVRTQGFAADDEEWNLDVRCVAVPIFDYRDKCVAAIGVSGPTTRISLENLQKISRILVDVGKEVSARMSFRDEKSNIQLPT
jgi:IclR family KDG regulon transcriptional repressor